MIIDFDNFYNFLTTSTDTFLFNFLIDLFYCVVFASINITSKKILYSIINFEDVIVLAIGIWCILDFCYYL